MLFRVSSFDICHIYRMEKEQVYMTVGEPESSVILKYIWGTASEQEKGEVDLWLKKHPENEKALLQIARIYYVCRTQERIVSRDPLKAYWKVDKMLKSQSYLKKYQKKDRYVIFHRIVIELLKVAAIVLILLGGNFLLQKDDQMESLPSFQTLYVPAGQRAELILPDSTKVWLNAQSTLTYSHDFGRNERNVELDGGAYFEVAKNREIPFYVNTETNQVRIVETHFNVCAYRGSNEFTTTLLEGIVDIYAKGSEHSLTRLGGTRFLFSGTESSERSVLLILIISVGKMVYTVLMILLLTCCLVRSAVTVTSSILCTFPVMESPFSCACISSGNRIKLQSRQSHSL